MLLGERRALLRESSLRNRCDVLRLERMLGGMSFFKGLSFEEIEELVLFAGYSPHAFFWGAWGPLQSEIGTGFRTNHVLVAGLDWDCCGMLLTMLLTAPLCPHSRLAKGLLGRASDA